MKYKMVEMKKTVLTSFGILCLLSIAFTIGSVFTVYILKAESTTRFVYDDSQGNSNAVFTGIEDAVSYTVDHKPECVEIELNYSGLAYQLNYNRVNEATISVTGFDKNVLVGKPELPLKQWRLVLPPNVKKRFNKTANIRTAGDTA